MRFYRFSVFFHFFYFFLFIFHYFFRGVVPAANGCGVYKPTPKSWLNRVQIMWKGSAATYMLFCHRWSHVKKKSHMVHIEVWWLPLQRASVPTVWLNRKSMCSLQGLGVWLKRFRFESYRWLYSIFPLEKFEQVTHEESWFYGTRKPPVLAPYGVLGVQSDTDGSGRAATPQQTGSIGAPL